jgi:hypothetical protein
MKAIWSSCASAFSLPGLKRSRGDDEPDMVMPGSKKANSEHFRITKMKNVDDDGESY